MIGNLGKGCYASTDLDGNNGHIGNCFKNADEIGSRNNEGTCPKLGASMETSGTETASPVVVPAVPINEISVGNDAALSKRMENQVSVNPVPAVTAVPKKDTPDTIQIPKGHGVWRYVSPSKLPRQSHEVFVESYLRESLIHLNPEIREQPDLADEVIYKLRAIVLSVRSDGLIRANEEMTAWLRNTSIAVKGGSVRIGYFGIDRGDIYQLKARMTASM